MAHLLISAAHKSSGKTTVSVGLCAALARRGLAIQAFKKGPDYIDPMWLAAATGRPCINLDFQTQTRPEIVATFARYAAGADIALIEGNKGLYDGLDLDGSNSNAALASLLGAPVVLVLDAQGMTRGIAPLILGHQAFDRSIRIAGVILNKVGGSRHEAKLRAIIEHYTDVPVLGAVHRDATIEIEERHLGLIPSNEAPTAAARIAAIAEAVARQVDLDHLVETAHQAAPPPIPVPARPPLAAHDVRIAVARDSAFGFYYAGDLEALEAAGAELLFFNTLRDPHLPPCDGLLIGGGFPETHMARLEANDSLRADLRAAIEGGLPTYAECGGLMYLARSLVWNGERRQMVGAIPADAVMYPTPQGRGYVRLRETGNGPWPLHSADGGPGEFAAHEFHYSRLEGIDGPLEFAYEVLRGTGVDGRHDGIVRGNLLASYVHLRDVEANPWARRFVAFVRTVRARRAAPAARSGTTG
jgi:cobyrinic acid a,c-diamide synthase